MLQLNDNTESESSTAAGRVFEKSEIGIPVPKIAENRKSDPRYVDRKAENGNRKSVGSN